MGTVAICFAEGGSRVPTSGGAYGYIEAAFGPLAGYVAGTLLWVGNVLACGGVALAGAPLGFPFLGAAALVSIVSMLVVIALAARGEILGLGALGALSALVYLIQTHAVPARS